MPITPQTLFCIGSISKVLTGTAIMRLVGHGRLDLDRSIQDYLPWLTFSLVGAAERITLRMLLSHISGLRTRDERSEAGLPRDPSGLAAFVRQTIPRLAFIAEPGRVFSYSNAGLSLAGYIAETIVGQYFPDLMRTLVFEPLEMRSTTYDRAVAMTYPLALPHEVAADGSIHAIHFYQTNTPGNPAGFAISTVLDLANLAIMHLNAGRFQDTPILAPALLAQMHKPHADLYATPGRGYGLTFWLDPYKGLRRVNHGGTIMTFRGYLELVPEAQVGLVMLANRWDMGSPVLDRLVERILDQLLDLPTPAPAPAPPASNLADWAGYLGHYWSYGQGVATIQVIDQQLTLDLNGWRVALQLLTNDRYIGLDGGLTAGFSATPDGAVEYLLIGLPAWSMTFKRIDLIWTPNPDTLAIYSGVYRLADDLIAEDQSLIVRIAANQLVFQLQGEAEAIGIPISETAFATKHGLFEFQQNLAGTIASVTLENEFTYVRSQV